MIKVLHLRSGSGLYGADRALLALAAATPAPFQPLVGSIVRGGIADELGEEARRLSLPARTFRSAGRLDLRLVREVAREARARRVQLFHAHDFKALWVALLAGAWAGIPTVATCHGETHATIAVRVYETFARVLCNFTRGVAAVSRRLESRLRRWVRLAPVAFVPNAIAMPRVPSAAERSQARAALGLDPDEYVVAVLGRLSPEKGHEVLLAAARQLARPPALLFAGDGPLRERLETAARGLPIRFLGYVAQTRPLLAAADAIAIPSLTEGLPLVALEALAHGRCVIATAVGELPEVLEDEAGLLVPPDDSSALARALEAARDPSTRDRFAGRGLERVRRYDVQAMASEYGRLYRSSLPPVRDAVASSSQ